MTYLEKRTGTSGAEQYDDQHGSDPSPRVRSARLL